MKIEIKQILRFIFFCVVIFGVADINAQSVFNKISLESLKITNEKSINTANLESSPAFIGDKVGYVFTNPKGKLFDNEIDEPYFDLGYSVVNSDNSLQASMSYGKKINSDFHEGPMSYDAQQNKMFFTRSHKETRSVKGTQTDTFYLRILSADLNEAKPSVKPININVQNYSVCHPTLSQDGKTMIFSSNKPGGFGKMDLYVAYFNGIEWNGIINVGDKLNSEYNEIFPYLLNDSLLIFASDMPDGFGGLDLFASKIENGIWSTPERLPAPFNSPYDDLGLIVRSNGRSGYFSSNRPGGKGKDDIYRFESQAPIFGNATTVMQSSQIVVLDKLTLQPIPQAEVTLTPLAIDVNNFTLSSYNIDMLSGRDPGDIVLKLSPKKGQSFPSFYTNQEGFAKFQGKKGQKYLIKVDAREYEAMSLIYDYDVFGASFNVVMEPKIEIGINENTKDDEEDNSLLSALISNEGEIDIPMEVGSVVVFENIYYEYNSSKILQGAAHELDGLVSIMIKNPKLKIRLESHTDSRGAAAYNMQLSIDRANAAREYLYKAGVDEDRILIKGYGESKLRNECTDLIPCTDAKHKYNRRTEVVILEQ